MKDTLKQYYILLPIAFPMFGAVKGNWYLFIISLFILLGFYFYSEQYIKLRSKIKYFPYVLLLGEAIALCIGLAKYNNFNQEILDIVFFTFLILMIYFFRKICKLIEK